MTRQSGWTLSINCFPLTLSARTGPGGARELDDDEVVGGIDEDFAWVGGAVNTAAVEMVDDDEDGDDGDGGDVASGGVGDEIDVVSAAGDVASLEMLLGASAAIVILDASG